MHQDLKSIKRHYGEEMMHLCRKLFPTILEKEGELFKILSNSFDYNKCLYEDLVNNNLICQFRDYIYRMYDNDRVIGDSKDKTPFELLDQVGYILYECKTEDDINKFRQYYKSDELLCTFNGGRLNTNYVFFAVKKNVDEIRREDYTNPDREDEYGTSVISIQFFRGKYNTVSIKNRYNDTVDNPDATFGNNLDNIVPGLSESFAKKYQLSEDGSDIKLEIPNYVKANDNKIYRYNYRINGIYYCTNNIIIKDYNVINDYCDKEKYLLMDYFVVDLVNKTVMTFNNVNDSFADRFKNIKNINIQNSDDKKIVTFMTEDNLLIKVVLNKYNQIVKYYDDYVRVCDNNYLKYNKYLKEVSLSNAISIGDNFMAENEVLEKIYAPKLYAVGNNFLAYNKMLESIYFPMLKYIAGCFMCTNNRIKMVYLPEVSYIGNFFMNRNNSVLCLILPKVIRIGNSFMGNNKCINYIDMFNLIETGDDFLCFNQELTYAYLFNLRKTGDNFFDYNQKIEIIYCPNLEDTGINFMSCNIMVREIDFPLLENIKEGFFKYNKNINMLTKTLKK